MQLSVTFKNIDPSDALSSYVQKKLDKFDKLLDNPAEAKVVLSVEKIRHIAEISLTSDGLRINAKESTESMYSSIDMLMDKVSKQIKKHKQKITNRRHGNSPRKPDGDKFENQPSEPVKKDSQEPSEQDKLIVEEINFKPMDIDEALLQMDLETDNFFVFTNSKTDRVNVLYTRKDGKTGLIQPSK